MRHATECDEAFADGARPVLSGEDRRAPTLDDAVHWVVVYEELGRFIAALESPSRVAVAHLERYCAMLSFSPRPAPTGGGRCTEGRHGERRLGHGLPPRGAALRGR
jgi:hypothetical protein